MRFYLIFLILLLTLFSSAEACNTLGECKYNTAQKVYFYVVDGTDGITPETGISYADVTIGYTKDDNTTGTMTLSADDCSTLTDGDWCEIDSTNQKGFYYFYEGTTATFNGKGNFVYVYSGSGHKTQAYGFIIKTETGDEESDTLAAIETDTGTDGVVVSFGALGDIADSVSDELTSGHTTSGSLGKTISDTLNKVKRIRR